MKNTIDTTLFFFGINNIYERTNMNILKMSVEQIGMCVSFPAAAATAAAVGRCVVMNVSITECVPYLNTLNE